MTSSRAWTAPPAGLRDSRIQFAGQSDRQRVWTLSCMRAWLANWKRWSVWTDQSPQRRNRARLGKALQAGLAGRPCGEIGPVTPV